VGTSLAALAWDEAGAEQPETEATCVPGAPMDARHKKPFDYADYGHARKFAGHLRDACLKQQSHL
jgi:hypothetical protein